MKTNFALAALAFALPTVLADSGYAQVCSNCTIDKTDLECFCKVTNIDTIQWLGIDLNNCIANYGNHIASAKEYVN